MVAHSFIETMIFYKIIKLLVPLLVPISTYTNFSFNLHISSSLPLAMNFSGCSIYISYSKSPCKKDVFTLSCSISNFKLAINLTTTQYTTSLYERKYFFKISTFFLTETLHNQSSVMLLL